MVADVEGGFVLFLGKFAWKYPNIMKLLENVDETLVSSYFSSEEVVRDKFQVSHSYFTDFLNRCPRAGFVKWGPVLGHSAPRALTVRCLSPEPGQMFLLEAGGQQPTEGPWQAEVSAMITS